MQQSLKLQKDVHRGIAVPNIMSSVYHLPYVATASCSSAAPNGGMHSLACLTRIRVHTQSIRYTPLQKTQGGELPGSPGIPHSRKNSLELSLLLGQESQIEECVRKSRLGHRLMSETQRCRQSTVPMGSLFPATG